MSRQSVKALPGLRARPESQVRDRAGAAGASMIMLAQWILPTVGFAILVQERGTVQGTTIVLIAPVLFILGTCLSRVLDPGVARSVPVERDFLPSFLATAAVVLAVLSVLHFRAVGIPLFSSSVETSRFDIGSSGLAGFPSRAVLYGLPIVALIGIATFRESTKRAALFLCATFAITQVFLGFKGGLIEVILISALGLAIRYGKLGVKQLIGLSAGGVLALAYVTFVGSKYQTLAGSESGLSYIVRRSTSDAIIAGYTALTARPVGIDSDTSVFLRDLSVLFGRYLGTAPEGYSFDELVSSVVTGTPIQRGAFLVPVTVGGPVYLLYSFPVVVCVVALILFGLVWRSSILRLRAATSPTVTIGAAVVIYGTRLFLMNGNGAYLLINLSFTFCLLLACAILGRLLRGPSHEGVVLPHRERDH